MITDFPYMDQALAEANAAYVRDEVPVGAVVVHVPTNRVVACTGNEVEARHNPMAHAEMLALEAACRELGSPRLPECDLYVTLEPCPMCAQAISFVRIRRLYYGAPDPKSGGVEHGAKIFTARSCHHSPDIYSGIGEAASGDLLRRFFQEKRDLGGKL